MEFRILGPLEGVARRPRGIARRPQAARAPCRAPPARQRGRVPRPADRRALGRGLDDRRRRRAARERLRLRKALPPDMLATDRRATSSRSSRAPSISIASSIWWRRGGVARCGWPDASERLREALALWRGPAFMDLRTNASRRQPSRGSTRSGSQLSSCGSTPTWHWAGTTSSSPSSRRSSPITRYVSASRLPDDSSLPVGPAGRGSGRLPRRAARPRRRARHRAGAELQELELAILQHDPGLDQDVPARPCRPGSDERSSSSRSPTRPASARSSQWPSRSCVIAGGCSSSQGCAERSRLGRIRLARRAPFRSSTREASRPERLPSRRPHRGGEVARLAGELDVELLLADAPDGLLAEGAPDEQLTTLLDETPCDVALLVPRDATPTGPVVVPFGGAEHDWAAVELGARLARADGCRWLAGAAAVPEQGRATRAACSPTARSPFSGCWASRPSRS